MLPYINRADKKAIEKIWKDGRFTNTPNLTFKYLKHKEATPPRIAFITPKASVKSAVKRNLLRRRGYALISKRLNQLLGYEGAFIFNKASNTKFGGRKTKVYNPINNLETEIDLILKKLNK